MVVSNVDINHDVMEVSCVDNVFVYGETTYLAGIVSGSIAVIDLDYYVIILDYLIN